MPRIREIRAIWMVGVLDAVVVVVFEYTVVCQPLDRGLVFLFCVFVSKRSIDSIDSSAEFGARCARGAARRRGAVVAGLY